MTTRKLLLPRSKQSGYTAACFLLPNHMSAQTMLTQVSGSDFFCLSRIVSEPVGSEKTQFCLVITSLTKDAGKKLATCLQSGFLKDYAQFLFPQAA